MKASRLLALGTAAALALATPLVGQQYESAGDDADVTDGKNIVETAIDAGSFQTLVAAVKAAGLVGTLSGEGPFTVFAPTDAAFEALPDGTLESLLQPENQGQLVDILTFHVVPGELLASDVLASTSLSTVLGQDLAVTTEGGVARVGNATIVQTDIRASNGVIHVIDAVLLP